MPFADSNRGQILYAAETTTLGTPDGKGFQTARFTSSDFTANKNTVVSDEIRSDRMVSDVTEVGFTSTGTLNIELSLRGTYDELMEAALGGTWTKGNLLTVAKNTYTAVASTKTITVGTQPAFVAGQKINIQGDASNSGIYTVASTTSTTIVVTESLNDVTGSSSDAVRAQILIWSDEVYVPAAATNPTVTASTKTYAVPSTSSVPSEWKPGQWVYVSGCTTASNNGWKRIVSLTSGASGSIVVDETCTDESVAGDFRIRGKMLRNGTVKRSFLIEQGFADIEQYFAYYGQRVGSMSLDISSGSTLTGSFGFQGTAVARSNASRTWYNTAAPTTSSSTVNATSNVGSLYSSFTDTSQVLATTLQSISINLDNALRDQAAVGNKYPKGIGYGRQTISGSITAYFENSTLYDKFLNHTTTSLVFVVQEADTDASAKVRFSLPNVKFQTDNPNIGGIDQDVIENIDFTAFAYTYDAPSGTDPVFQIQIDMIPAA